MITVTHGVLPEDGGDGGRETCEKQAGRSFNEGEGSPSIPL